MDQDSQNVKTNTFETECYSIKLPENTDMEVFKDADSAGGLSIKLKKQKGQFLATGIASVDATSSPVQSIDELYHQYLKPGMMLESIFTIGEKQQLLFDNVPALKVELTEKDNPASDVHHIVYLVYRPQPESNLAAKSENAQKINSYLFSIDTADKTLFQYIDDAFKNLQWK